MTETPTQGIKRWWVAEGHGANDRRWLVFAYESGTQWQEMRVYGPPSCRAPIYRFSVDGQPTIYHLGEIYDRAMPVLQVALQWIANPLPTTLQIIKQRYEDE